MNRWRHKEVKSASKGDGANKWQNGDLNPGLLTLEPTLLTMKLYCCMKLYDIAAYSFFEDYVVFKILCSTIYTEHKYVPWDFTMSIFLWISPIQFKVSIYLKF